MPNSRADSNWKKTLLLDSSSLGDAIKNLDYSGLQINLVISGDQSFVGTITDGDIRRALLRGTPLSSSIENVIHREAMVVPPHISHEMALNLMKANVISALPIIDENRHVVGLHLLNELLVASSLLNTMIIMAGGQGSRLRPHTENCPKPLIPVAGKPMMQHIIERAKSQGISRMIISVHYLGEMIQDYFGDGSKFGMDISYIVEDHPLGTAGAISLINTRPDLPFIVTNGDVLTDINYAELLDFHNRHNACGTMAVRLHEWQHQFGVVNINGVNIVGFEEKPITRSYINAGIYVLQPQALDFLEEGQYCDMPTLFSRLRDKGNTTIVYPMHEPWLDVGRPGDLIEANNIKKLSN
jgi:dTDP-glucose pyrophosphorylase